MRLLCLAILLVVFTTASATCSAGCTHCFDESRSNCNGNVNDADCYSAGSVPGTGATWCFECNTGASLDTASLSADATFSNVRLSCSDSKLIRSDTRTLTVTNEFYVEAGSTLRLENSFLSELVLSNPNTQSNPHVRTGGRVEVTGGRIIGPSTGVGHQLRINGEVVVLDDDLPDIIDFPGGVIVGDGGSIVTDHDGGQAFNFFNSPLVITGTGFMRLTRRNSGGGTIASSDSGTTNRIESGGVVEMASNQWFGTEDETVWEIEAGGRMTLQSSGMWSNNGGVHNYGTVQAKIYDDTIDELHAGALFGDHYVQYPGARLEIWPNNGDEWPAMPTAQSEIMDIRGGDIVIESSEAFIYGGSLTVKDTDITMRLNSHIEWGTATASTDPITFEDVNVTVSYFNDGWPDDRFLWHIYPRNGGVELVNDLSLNLGLGSFDEDNVYFKWLSVRNAGTRLGGAGEVKLNLDSDKCWEQRLDLVEVPGMDAPDYQYIFVLWQCGTEEPDVFTPPVSSFLIWAAIGGVILCIGLVGIVFAVSRGVGKGPVPSYHQYGPGYGQGGPGYGQGAPGYGPGGKDPNYYGAPPAQGGLLQKQGPGPDATTQASGMSRGKRNSGGERRGSGGSNRSAGSRRSAGSKRNSGAKRGGTGGSQRGSGAKRGNARRRSKSPAGVSKGSRGRSPRRNGAAPAY